MKVAQCSYLFSVFLFARIFSVSSFNNVPNVVLTNKKGFGSSGNLMYCSLNKFFLLINLDMSFYQLAIKLIFFFNIFIFSLLGNQCLKILISPNKFFMQVVTVALRILFDLSPSNVSFNRLCKITLVFYLLKQ